MSDSFETPWTVVCQAPLSMEFSRPEHRSGVVIPFSRGSSWPKDQTPVSCLGLITTEPPEKPPKYVYVYFSKIFSIYRLLQDTKLVPRAAQ